jgi:hypothetical protein
MRFQTSAIPMIFGFLLAGAPTACSGGHGSLNADAAQGTGGTAGAAGTGGGAGVTGGAGTSGSAGTTGGAGTSGSDECHADGDCPQGICSTPPCSELLCALGTDGFHHCTPRTPPTLDACPDASATSCCRADADCTAMPRGHCVPHALDYCGGALPLQGNECRYDACASDADCTASADGICTTGYPRACLYGPCRGNADCTSGPGGRCVMTTVGTYCLHAAVFCRYTNDSCTSNAPCLADGGAFRACLPNTNLQGESCQSVPPPPP